MTLPCDCCPTGPPQCALVAVQFTGVSETAAQAGWNQTNLALTIDGVVSSTANSGYLSPAGNTPTTTLQVTYTLPSTNRVRGLRLWNQCGTNLGDADGLGQFTADFYAGPALLATMNPLGINGAGALTYTLPGATELAGVDRVVLRDLSKQQNGTVAPLWRELQLLALQTVFPCRRRNGTLEWYDEAGNQVPTADVGVCPDGTQPLLVPDLRMQGAAFGDDPGGIAENMCNVVPAPATATGWTFNAGTGCYDPTVGGPVFTWAPTSSVEMSYGQSPSGGSSGGVTVQFSSPSLAPGGISWPTHFTDMAVGEQRVSLPFAGGRRARLTYLSGPAVGSPSRTITTSGGIAIGLHLGNVSAAAPIRFRLDLTQS